jgi:hypothetical protein
MSNKSCLDREYSDLVKISNKKEYSRFSDSKIVYQYDNMFFCLDILNKKILYYMRYDVSYTKILGSFLWQSLVWRDEKSPQVKTLPHKIFFKELLPKWGIIATDGQQTSDGRRFWEYQIAYALEQNINVYYFNLKSKELVQISTLDEFDKAIHQYDIWGDTIEHRNKLMVISIFSLPKNNEG